MEKSKLQFGTGANLNPIDHRDISVSAFETPATTRPKKIILDLSKVPPKNQGGLGSCVGHAETTAIEYNEWLDTLITTPLSPRDLYAECKRRDGFKGQGTYPRVAGLAIVDRGIATLEEVPNDVNLSHEAYINTKKDADTAILSRQRGFAGVPIDYTFIADQLAKGRIVAFSMPTMGADMSSTPIKPSLTTLDGWHRVAFYGYEDISDKDGILYMVNSWGENWGFKVQGAGGFHGCNTLIFSEWKTRLGDLQVYTDIPTELIKKAREASKDFAHTFSTDLKLGMRGTEVSALQKALLLTRDYYSEFYGDYLDTGYFGKITLASVKRFQARYGLPVTGYVGKLTRGKLNELTSKKKA
jgi:hypothetical protein